MFIESKVHLQTPHQGRVALGWHRSESIGSYEKSHNVEAVEPWQWSRKSYAGVRVGIFALLVIPTEGCEFGIVLVVPATSAPES